MCYSNYGEVPQINACGSVINGYYYDLYTGQGPNTTENKEETRYEFDENTTINEHGYSTANGMLASTTGNITGIYDMNGGSWERVAAYLNNGNENLDNYGKSTSNTDVKYFENGKVKSEYSSLWEGYEVSEEEKNNKIKGLEENEFLTQTDLWKNKDNTYNSVRKRITDETFELLKQVKGIGVNEVANSHSYYGKLSDGIYQWFTDAGDTTTKYGRTWNSDLVLIGHASFPFVLRGGGCGGGSGSGVLCSDITYGFANYNQGFRAVLVV